MSFRIAGSGSYLPEKILTNDDISKMVDTSDEWIKERTGIEKRHIINGDTSESMAAMACRRALEYANASADQVEAIILATCSSGIAVPCIACRVQSLIGAVNAVAFDINAACSGFLFAMNIAASYIQTGIYKRILVAGVETLSKIVDYKDRGTCILFGDGAGAVYLEADSSKNGCYKYLQGADGNKGNVLSVDSYISMDGREVFKFATRKVPECIEQLLEREGIDKNEVDLYILHQANRRIIESASARLKVDISKFPINVDSVGNTSSASVPVLLDELIRTGKIVDGMTIVMSGFGAGLTYGASVMTI